jgi:hypothetical protein
MVTAKDAEIEVRYGDRFRVGAHLFQCGDLLSPGEWEGLLRAWRKHSRSPVGWAYSDPPWNAGNLRYWRTHAGGEAPRQDFDRFCARFAECVAMLEPRAAYVEQSVHEPSALILAASREPAWPHLRGRWDILYGSPRRPNLLLRFAAHDWDGDPSGLHGEAATAHVFDREPLAAEKAAVCDPCIGLGMTVRMAHARGIACLGNELNPARLARTIGWLVRRGLEVERL